ncbi:MAG: hypothetical protein ACYDEA_12665 [Candidatus Dormibacteria bacterium]
MMRMGGLGTGLVVAVPLGATGAVAGPPVVQGTLRAAVPFGESGVRDAVSAVSHMVPPAPAKPGGTTHG